jgi:SAM-dependent methyltransferase
MRPHLAFPSRRCAVCGSTAKRLLYQQSFSSFSGGLLEGYDVVACTRCGFAFGDHIPDQAAFDRYYGEMSKYEYNDKGGHESSYDLAKFQEIATFIQPYLRSRAARILEVGCATGRLLGLIKQAGYPNVLGVDPSAACVRAATALYGVPAITGTFSRMDVPPGSQDFLILSGVLEHVRDLDVALRCLLQLLADGGRLHIVVPDASRYAEGEDAPFQEFSVEHINFFGPDSLANLLVDHGFRSIFCDQRMITVNHRTTTPAILGVFEKSSGDQPAAALNPDLKTASALERYIVKSAEADRQIHAAISLLADEQTPVMVWGTGAHTLRLLETSRLGEARITAFIDSNTRYQDKKLRGVPILAPEAVRGRFEPILISSRVYQHEIANRIQNEMSLPNRVIRLYAI